MRQWPRVAPIRSIVSTLWPFNRGPLRDAGSEIPDGAKGWKRFRGLRKFQRIIERVPDQGCCKRGCRKVAAGFRGMHKS